MLKFKVVDKYLVSKAEKSTKIYSKSSKSKVSEITGTGNFLFKIKPSSSIFPHHLQKFTREGKFWAILRKTHKHRKEILGKELPKIIKLSTTIHSTATWIFDSFNPYPSML